ncbi:hypothetical protein [Streptomyces sp. NPDC004230]
MTKSTAADSEPQTVEKDTPALRGGLPEDEALGAFSIDSRAALTAFAPRAGSPSNPHDTAARVGGVESVSGSAAPAAPATMRPVHTSPPQQVSVPPDTSSASASSTATQCTIMVQPQVRNRFANYQTTQKVETGREPTNAVVVKRAFLHAHKNDLWVQLRESVRHRQTPVSDEDADPDGLFGDVPARRVDRGGVKHGVQQSFRPSLQELAVYDAYASAYGFDNRSDCLDACLDAFLPPLPSARRPGRGPVREAGGA